MKLEQQDIEFRLGLAGVDQKTDEKYAPLGRATELVNVRFPKTGVIAKRSGLQSATSDTSSGSIGMLARIIEGRDRLLALSASSVGRRIWYSLTRAANGDPLAAGLNVVSVNTGGFAGSGYASAPVAKAWIDDVSASQQWLGTLNSVDMAIGQSQTCYVYRTSESSNQIRATIVDSATGAPVLFDTGLEDTGGGTSRYFVFAVPSSNAFVIVSTGSLAGFFRVTLVTSAGPIDTNAGLALNTNYAWDAAMVGNSLLIAHRTSGATTLTVRKFTVSATALGAATSSAAKTMTVGPVNVAIAVPLTSADSNIAIFVNDATNGLRGLTVSVSTLNTVQALWTLDSALRTMNHLTAAMYGTGTNVIVLGEIANATDYLVETHQWITTIGSSASDGVLAQMYLCSKPRIANRGSAEPILTEYPFVVLGHLSKQGTSDGLQNARFLYETVSAVVQARFIVNEADLPPTVLSSSTLSNIATMPPDTSVYGAPVTEFACANVRIKQRIVKETGTTKIRSIMAMRFNVHPKYGYVACQDGDTTLIQAGYLALFDGTQVTENGFLLYPEIVSVTSSATGGSVPSSANIKVVAVFFYVDGTGQIHRSAPSEVYDATTGVGHDTLTVRVRGLWPTVKTSIGIEIYRTEDDGSEFYLADAVYGTSPIGSSIDIVMTGSDSTLTASTPLGQQNGIADNAQPSCPIGIESNGRRLLVFDGSDRNAVRESKERRSGEGCAFFESASRRIASGGDTIAITTFGERWAAMKKRSLFIASGDGADDARQGDTLSEFEQHPMSGVGCLNARSIVRCSIGTVFQSERGFYLLDAGGNLTPIGVSVDDFKDFPVRAGVFNPSRNEVVYLLEDGPRLVLSLHETEQGIQPRWSVDEDDDAAAPYGDIAFFDGRIYVAGEDRTGSAFRTLRTEDIGGYADQGSNFPVIMRVTTGWIPLTWARLYEARFLGTVREVHTARVRAAYDFVDTWVDDKSITSANATAGGTAPYEWAFRPTRPRARAIKLQFTETLESASRGCELNSIVLTVGMLPGKKRLQSRQRAVA